MLGIMCSILAISSVLDGDILWGTFLGILSALNLFIYKIKGDKESKED